MSDLVGKTIGNYQVLGLLGEGGMGQVYRATHPEIGRFVAIKVLSADLAAEPEVIDRFRTEALAVNRIAHPNIIDISDFGALPDGRPYFVMEYLDGETLEARLQRDTQLALDEAAPLLRQILAALEAAHEAGIVHRDLKPENIYVARRRDGDIVKLLDFGIAKLLSPDKLGSTADGQMLGTPYYMSPEQALGKASEVGPTADVYSLGIILYRLLSGALPFDGPTFGALIMAHASEEPPSLQARCPELPPGLVAVVDRCLAKRPLDRYRTIAELRAALAEHLPMAGGTLPELAGLSGVRSATAERAGRGPTRPLDYASGGKPTGPSGPVAPGATSPVEPNAAAPSAAGTTVPPLATTHSRPRWLLPVVIVGLLGGGLGAWATWSRSRPPAPPEALPLPAPPHPLLDGKELLPN